MAEEETPEARYEREYWAWIGADLDEWAELPWPTQEGVEEQAEAYDEERWQ